MPIASAIQWKRLTAEGVAIVLSILMAFWIDAWWEYRGELIDEIEILQNLESEFLGNREILREDIEDVSDYIQATRRLLTAAAMDSSTHLSVDSLGVDLWRTMTWRTTNLSTATLDSVISVGNLALIRNDVLRNSMI